MAPVERPPRNTFGMDCCICRSAASSVYSSPRNICSKCYEGAKAIFTYVNEANDGAAGPHASKSTSMSAEERLRLGIKWVRELKEKVSFLDAVAAMREGILTDILVKPGSGPPIPTHRAVLAAKSKILRTMLLSDDCKAAAEDTISLPELSHYELKCLVEFLYSGSLPAPPDKDSSSLYYSLLIASDKYDIPFLRQQCRSRILAALDTSNALDVLQFSHVCSDAVLKEQATNLIVDKAKDVVFSDGYEEFARRNVHLSVHITRELATRNKPRATSATNYC